MLHALRHRHSTYLSYHFYTLPFLTVFWSFRTHSFNSLSGAFQYLTTQVIKSVFDSKFRYCLPQPDYSLHTYTDWESQPSRMPHSHSCQFNTQFIVIFLHKTAASRAITHTLKLWTQAIVSLTPRWKTRHTWTTRVPFP